MFEWIILERLAVVVVISLLGFIPIILIVLAYMSMVKILNFYYSLKKKATQGSRTGGNHD